MLVIDNYDSFTHNLVDLLAQLGARVQVLRNDALSVPEVLKQSWAGVVLSPGPGRPKDAGISLGLIRALRGRLPLLGVCLGHQCLAAAYGGAVIRARRPLHGTAAPVHHRGAGSLRGLPRPFEAARYHSLVVDPRRLGAGFRATAHSDEGEVMAMRHVRHPVEGVQFHPESYLTPRGPWILASFLRGAGLEPAPPTGVRR